MKLLDGIDAKINFEIQYVNVKENVVVVLGKWLSLIKLLITNGTIVA